MVVENRFLNHYSLNPIIYKIPIMVLNPKPQTLNL